MIVLRSYRTNEVEVIFDDREGLIEFLSIRPNIVMCGYNNSHYDKYILKAIMCDINPKEVNDFIINGGQGWEFPFNSNYFVNLPHQIDLMQDTLGLGLKEIEGNIGWNIKETEVDFNIDRRLTYEEIKLTEEYCRADVAILPKLWELRQDYINAKVTLCEIAEIPLEEGLGLTNAKLTAKFLKANKELQPPRRSFDYTSIKNVRWELIPLEVQEYFDRILDDKVEDSDFESGKLEFDFVGIPTIIASGGIHGARLNFNYKVNEDEYILEYDVSSLYPSLVINHNYHSRNVPNPKQYEDIYHTRLKAKKEGNKKIANAYKLILNTYYGTLNSEYNDLYDPSMSLAVCVTGQILLCELCQDLYDNVPSIVFVQHNTDATMFKIKKEDYDKVLEIVHNWEQLHNLSMEEDRIVRIAQRDVNNYCISKENNSVTFKGGELNNYNPNGEVRWKKHSLEICAEALVKKLLFDVPIEDTINNCNDLSKFQ